MCEEQEASVPEERRRACEDEEQRKAESRVQGAAHAHADHLDQVEDGGVDLLLGCHHRHVAGDIHVRRSPGGTEIFKTKECNTHTMSPSSSLSSIFIVMWRKSRLILSESIIDSAYSPYHTSGLKITTSLDSHVSTADV